MGPKRQPNTNNITNMASIITSIAPFDGNPSEIEFFFESITDAQSLNSLSEAQTIAILKQKLTGEAKKFYIEDPDLKKNKTIKQFRDSFEKYFRKFENTEQLWNELSMLPDESYIKLAHRLNNMANKLFPDVDENQLNKFKLVKLKQIVPFSMKAKLIKKNFATFKEAIEYAQKHQDVHFAINDVEPMENLKHVAHCSHENKMLHSDKNEKQTKHKNRSFSNNSEKWNKSRNNYKKFQNSGNYKSKFHNLNRKQNEFQKKNPIKCQFCDRYGHILKYCRDFKSFCNRGNLASAPLLPLPNNNNNIPQMFTLQAITAPSTSQGNANNNLN